MNSIFKPTLLMFILGFGGAMAAKADDQDYKRYDPADYSQEVTECDRQAGHKEDPHRVIPGKSRSEIDLPRAIEACKAAVAADPENPRLRYLLGRTYGYSNMGDMAMEHRLKAVDAGYPQSLFVIGYLYTIGQTIEKDLCKGAELIRRSAEAGRIAGQLGFTHHALRGDYNECDVRKDPEEMRGFLQAAREKGPDYYQNILIEELESRLAEG